MSCSKCKDMGHLFKEGIWQRCSCISQSILVRKMIAAGVDSRSIQGKLAQIKETNSKVKYLLVRNWVVAYRKRLIKGDFHPAGWFICPSFEERGLILLSLAKVTFEAGKLAKIYYLRDLLMEISDNRSRQQIYDVAMRYELVCFSLDIESIAARGLDFVIKFIILIIQRRLREGKAIVVVSKPTTDFKKYIGHEMHEILKRDFERMEV